MHCLICTNDSYFIYNDDLNNCYYQNETLINQKYYLSINDYKFHKCYYSCSTCQNFEPNETENYCIYCSEGYYFLENTTNCYDMNITEKGYYLDNSTMNIGEIEPIFKKCYESCKTCIKYKEKTGDKEEIHNCLKCAEYYYKLENGLYPFNCYDNETIKSWTFFEDSTINTIEIIKENEIEDEEFNPEETDYKKELKEESEIFPEEEYFIREEESIEKENKLEEKSSINIYESKNFIEKEEYIKENEEEFSLKEIEYFRKKENHVEFITENKEYFKNEELVLEEEEDYFK